MELRAETINVEAAVEGMECLDPGDFLDGNPRYRTQVSANQAAAQQAPLLARSPDFDYLVPVAQFRLGQHGKGDIIYHWPAGHMTRQRTRMVHPNTYHWARRNRATGHYQYFFSAVPAWVTTDNNAALDLLALNPHGRIAVSGLCPDASVFSLRFDSWLNRTELHDTLLSEVNHGTDAAYILPSLIMRCITTGQWRNYPQWPKVELGVFYTIPLPAHIFRSSLPPLANEAHPAGILGAVTTWLGHQQVALPYWLCRAITPGQPQETFHDHTKAILQDALDPLTVALRLTAELPEPLTLQVVTKYRDFWLLFTRENWQQLNWFTLLHLQAKGKPDHLRSQGFTDVLPPMPEEPMALLAFLNNELPHISPAALFTAAKV